jgi:predicted ATPase
VLVVLDNCEHVIEAVGSLADTITHASPEVRVLATSREALAIDGELLGPVGSLPVPEEPASAEDLLAAPSVRLFVDRAAAVRPDLVLDDTSAPVVADICRQLDGVPLAIELAAARVASLTVGEIAQRLDQRFRLLTGGRRTALERHQTLRAAVDWSYELLAPDEARVFNRLAVFAGGFTLAAAEAVVGGDGIGDADVLELLSGLVARSMLAADEVEGVTRYRLHETMRQYAREHLFAIGEQDVVRARHARYFVTLAEAIAVGVTGRDEQHWVHTADVELANLRVALDWSVATGDADLALRESVALGRFGLGRLSYKVWDWLDLAAAMPEARHHPLRPYVMALASQPYLVLTGDLTAAAERLRAAQAALDEAGLAPSSVLLFARAGMASVTGRTADARIHGAAAIERSLATGDRHLAGMQAAMLALFLASGGDIDAAVSQAERALGLARELENSSLFAISQCALGYALSTVDPERAIPHLETAIAASADVANEMAHDIAERCLARVSARRGDLGTAAALYRDCLDRAIDLAGGLPIALTCESLAVDLTATDHHDVAATIFGALEAPADAYRGNPMVRRADAISRLHQLISNTKYEECVALGRAMDTDALATFTRSALDQIIAQHAPVTPDQ